MPQTINEIGKNAVSSTAAIGMSITAKNDAPLQIRPRLPWIALTSSITMP